MKSQSFFDYSLSQLLSLLLLGILFYLSLVIIKPFLSLILVAIIVTIFLQPLHNNISKIIPNHKISAFLSLISFLLIILLPLAFVIQLAVHETYLALTHLEIESLTIDSFEALVNQIIRRWDVLGLGLSINVSQITATAVTSLSQNIGRVIALTGNSLINIFITLLTTYFLLSNKDEVYRYVIKYSPLPVRHRDILVTRAEELINGTVRGNLAVIGLQTLVGFVGFYLFGLPSPALLSFIYGLVSIVPSIGAALVWIPTALFLLLTRSWIQAVLFILWILASNLVIDNYVAPKIIGKQTRLHQIIILFSVLGGLQAFGFLGIILGPTIIALSFVALEIYRSMITHPEKTSS